ncbi:hypothetical protein [Streptomyces sp. CB01881]|uniref:hypothetical protein n=1 Tax=Streptomyces sp. CB01881 TaxID=2078691 RepID=UPI00129D1D43|nr:hypothetical protein [Streptomyces sp. CB01881]
MTEQSASAPEAFPDTSNLTIRVLNPQGGTQADPGFGWHWGPKGQDPIHENDTDLR